MSFAAVAAAGIGISAAGSLASGFMGSDAAEDAAGIQSQYLDLGIDELRGALEPSIAELQRQQRWSDRHLQRQSRNSMRETAPYANAGRRGLSRLNYLLGTDNGLGPQPTAPTAPRPPKYSKDPAQAAAQKKQYQKDLRAYEKARAKYQTDSASYAARADAQANDPAFGSLMRPYEDRFEARIDEAVNKYGGQILDTAAEKYDDKYAEEILGVARDKFGRDDFEADPGYEFRREEGGRGIEQSAAARGGLLSGAAAKELTRFNQDTASDEFDRAHGRWADQHNRHLTGLRGQQAQDYGAWGDNKNTRLGALQGQQGTELGSLIDRRNFDFGNFEDNRNFQYGALTDQVGIGQDAVNDRIQNRQWTAGQRTGNRLSTAGQIGDWRQANAATIAQFLASQGNAQAAGQINSANAWGNAFQGAGNALATGLGFFANGRNRSPSGSGGRNFTNENGYIVSY